MSLVLRCRAERSALALMSRAVTLTSKPSHDPPNSPVRPPSKNVEDQGRTQTEEKHSRDSLSRCSAAETPRHQPQQTEPNPKLADDDPDPGPPANLVSTHRCGLKVRLGITLIATTSGESRASDEGPVLQPHTRLKWAEVNPQRRGDDDRASNDECSFNLWCHGLVSSCNTTASAVTGATQAGALPRPH